MRIATVDTASAQPGQLIAASIEGSESVRLVDAASDRLELVLAPFPDGGGTQRRVRAWVAHLATLNDELAWVGERFRDADSEAERPGAEGPIEHQLVGLESEVRDGAPRRTLRQNPQPRPHRPVAAVSNSVRRSRGPLRSVEARRTATGDVGLERRRRVWLARGLRPNAARIAATAQGRFRLRGVGGIARRRVAGTATVSDHATGRAVDLMVAPRSAEGDRVAAWAIRQPGVKYVIWNRRIWTPARGWRRYVHPGVRRGVVKDSPTLRHEDHVHVSVR